MSKVGDVEVSDEQVREANRANWDERAPLHAAAASYHLAQYAADPSLLSSGPRHRCRFLAS